MVEEVEDPILKKLNGKANQQPVTQEAQPAAETDPILQKLNAGLKKKEPTGSVSPVPAQKPGEPSGENTVQVSQKQQKEDTEIPAEPLPSPAETSFIKTIKSGIADQLPKEYYIQRLRMSKGSFGDLFDPRSDLNAFGSKLPAGISRNEFARWSNNNRDKILGKSYDDRAKTFLTEKLGAQGYEQMKAAFQEEQPKVRAGFESEIQEQNKEAAQRMSGVVQNLKDVDGAGAFLNFAGNMLGQALYRAPTSILSGGVGSIVSESSAVYDRQLDLIAEKKGISRQEVIKQGLDKPAEGQALAVLAGELDALSSVNLIGLFRKAAVKELTKNAVKEFTKGFVKGGVPEALTEAAQGEIEEFAAAKGAEVDYSADAWRIATGAAGGLIGGGLISGGTSVKLTPDQQTKPVAQVIQEEVNNPDLEKAAETIQAKVEQSGDSGVYTFNQPTSDQETQATPAPQPAEGEISETQKEETLPVQEEGATTETVISDDSQNQQRVQSDQREGQESIQTKPEQGTGAGEAEAGRVFQKQEEVTGPESGSYNYGDQSKQTVPQPETSAAPNNPRLGRDQGDQIQPPGAGQPEVSPQQPAGTRTLKIAERILESDANEAIKRGIREKGAEYIPKRLEITNKEATDLLDLYGNEKAETVIRDTKNEITGDTRTALAARLYERYKSEADAATDPGVKQTFYNKAVDIALFGANQAKEAGRAVNANKIWKAITADEDMVVLAMEKENQNVARQVIAPIQSEVTQTKEQFDEQIRRMVEQKVTETVETRLARAKLITKDQKKKISDAFDSLKVKDVKGTANDVIRVVGAAVWNGSMEAVKRAVLTGADVANAVQAGIDYIRDNYKGTDFDEAEFRDFVSRGISDSIPKAKISPESIDEKAIKTPRLRGRKKKQFIEQLVDEYNEKGEISDDRFEQIYAKQLGYEEYTDEDRAKIRELAKVISDAEKFAEETKNNFTRENIAKYQDMLSRAQKANKDLQEFARKPSNVWDTLITIMQGNLLTPLSIVTNVYSNAALQPLRFLSTGAGSLVDQAVAGLAKIDLLGRAYKDPTIDLVALQKGLLPGGWNGIMEGLKQLKEGQLASDKDLREIQSGFNPVSAVRRWADQDRTLDQKINDAIEGTFGFPAEGMFRLLNFGDKPFRRAAEMSRAMEIAAKRRLKGDDVMKFIMFPDETAAKEIDEAGKKATFQNESQAGKIAQAVITILFEGGNIPKVGKVPGIASLPYIGGPLKLLVKSQIPFVKTPVNIIVETFDYALPEVTFLRGVYGITKGNRRDGSVLVGKAVVGWTIRWAASQLFALGLLSWEDDKDKKGKNIQYDTVPPGSINMSAISRGLSGQGWEIKDDDAWVAYKKMGVTGILFDNYTSTYFNSIKQEQQMQGYVAEILTSAPRLLSSSLEQTFLKGTNSFLNALQGDDEYQQQQWAIETIGAISSIVLPNTAATISKSSDEYIRDTYNRDFGERLKATFEAKVFLGGQLAPKINLWGDKVTGNPEGRNKYTYYLFDPTKFKNVDTDNYKWKLYEAWKGDKFNSEWLPSMPTRSLKVRGVDMKLSPKEYELLCTFVGQERARATQAYVNSAWKYHDNERRIETLRDIYQEARDRGKDKFMMRTGWGVLTPKKLEAIVKNR